jgi:hypothetical protein
MNTPEEITGALWAERSEYPHLHNDEFESERALLQHVKHEMRAIRSFTDLVGARAWFKDMNDAAAKIKRQ